METSNFFSHVPSLRGLSVAEARSNPEYPPLLEGGGGGAFGLLHSARNDENVKNGVFRTFL